MFPMSHKGAWLGGVAVVALVAAGAVYWQFNNLVPPVAMAINYFKYMGAPKGTLAVETAPDAPPLPEIRASATSPASTDWPSYNRTLRSDRFAPETEVTPANAGGLEVLCTYDTGQYTGFNSGILQVDGALFFSTEYDTFSIDPNTCKEKWRVHEDYTPASAQGVSRGPAYLDHKLFRGTQDGRVLAYDSATGKRLWATEIADVKKGETAPAAPIAWNGLVFTGNAGGDVKGVKGRMYALNAETGKIVWEFYLVPKAPGDPERGPQAASPLDDSSWSANKNITGGATWTSYTLDPNSGLLYVPGGNPAPDFAEGARPGANLYSGSVVVLDAKTGAYKTHFKIVPKDWHDWDVSSAPVVVKTAAGTSMLLEAPKDGHFYGIDLGAGKQVYRVPATRIDNVDAPFEPGKSVHFCPGATGGAEWNGPAFDPRSNLAFVGEIQWCSTVTVQTNEAVAKVAAGQPWSGEATMNPYNTWGKADPTFDWKGWLYAFDADSGKWRWRAQSNYPVQSGVTPTAGGVVFFGDMGGNLYALNSATGEKLWGQKIGGAVGGGVISYDTGAGQRIAAATGLTEVLWPTEITTAKVSILGLKPKS
jgi:alcohol dehydrogenase (cytochrome c)